MFIGLKELGELEFIEFVLLLNCGFGNNVDVGLLTLGERVRFLPDIL
jgi:hypothetical protein